VYIVHNQTSPHRVDRLLAKNEEPPLGAHLVTPRFAYAHHGVYVGGGTVVHYAAFAKLWHRGPVEETSLARFADGHPVSVRPARRNQLQCVEIVRRARSRLGEDRYRFLSNNCEHLSEWCVNGEHRSPQVEQLLARLQQLSRVLSGLRRFLEVSPPRRSASPRPTY
jgi:Lecithin retinol acyltransferase